MSANISIPTLIDCFSDLPDPRIDRCKRHRLIDIVVIGLCSVICGAEGPTEMETFGKVKKEWLKQFLELPHGIPSHDTFGRVLSVIDPREFERCLLKWVNGQVKLSEGEVIALDGKTLRRSHDKAQEQEAIEIVSAWAVSQRLTLGQVKVAKEGAQLIIELSKLWSGRKVVAFQVIGYAWGGEMLRPGAKCTEPGMRATWETHEALDRRQEEAIRKRWNDLEKLPWAWEGHYAAKVAQNGKLIKDA